MSTRQVKIQKKMKGDLVTFYPLTKSNMVQVGDKTLDSELITIKNSILRTIPIGTVIIWFGDAYPTGWLSLDGQAISRTTYQELFSIYGSTFGDGDGSTTFNLPNQNYSDNDNLDDTQYKFIVKAIDNSNNNELSSIALTNIMSLSDNEVASTLYSYTEESNNGSYLINLPIGSLINYAGQTIPDTYLPADGRTLLKDEYEELYNIIGDSFTNSDNINTEYFNIPFIDDISDNVCTIIKVSGNVNIDNFVSNSKSSVVNSEIVQSLLERIKNLEDILGIN